MRTDFANLVLAVSCASSVASEYSTGMIGLTFAATSRRWKVFAVKAIVLAANALLAGALAAIAAFGAGRLVLLAHDFPVVSPDDSNC